MKALIAEDSKASVELLQVLLEDSGYDALKVSNASVTIDMFRSHMPDIVFLDVFLGGVNAFDLAQQMKLLTKKDPVSIVFVVTDVDEKLLAECLAAGADDFITKPFSQALLKAKIESLSRQRQMYETLKAQRDEMRKREQYVKQEQVVAKKVFDNIMSAGCLDAACMESHVSSVSLFNGDIVLAAERPNGAICILVGDLTGTGLSAALGGVPVSEVFYSMVSKGFSLFEIAIEIDRKLKIQLPDEMSMLGCLAELDPLNGVVRVWNAGIPTVYLFSIAKLDITHKFAPTEQPLGGVDQQELVDNTVVMDIAEGDRLFFATDGLSDAVNDDKEPFGAERIEDAIRYGYSQQNLMAQVLSAITLFVEDEAQSDDFTILIVTAEERTQKVLAASQRFPEQEVKSCNWSMDIELGSLVLKSADPVVLVTQAIADLMGTNKHARSCTSILRDIVNLNIDAGVLGLDPELKFSSQNVTDYYKQREKLLRTEYGGQVKFNIKSESAVDHGAIYVAAYAEPNHDVGQYYAKDQLPQSTVLIDGLCDEFDIDTEHRSMRATYRWHTTKE